MVRDAAARQISQRLRGAHVDDTNGQQMRAIAHSIEKELIDDVALYVAGLPVSLSQSSLNGDQKKEKYLYEENCMNCHRYNASGEITFGSPPLTGLQDWYILSQLKKFRAGIRGAH